MSEELENSVREMLKEETWTRAGISNFTKNNVAELEAVLERTRKENCEKVIKDICDEQLAHTKESIVALYLSGMIALQTGSLDNSALVSLVDIFEKNHKELLIEQLCENILATDPQNKFALRKLAEYYKATNDDRIWGIYEQIVKLDLEEADIAKLLAERYENQQNQEVAVNYYKKALLRYVAAKNMNSVKEIWSKLVALIPEDIDFFLLVQRKIAKSISEDKSITLMQELYQYYKNTAKWNTAISILKLILEIDSKDMQARRELVECYRGKYASHSHLEDYIKSSNLNQSFRNVFEAMSDFEKHIAFDEKSYVFHRSWGVGVIRKVQGDMLSINFGKKNGVHEMSLKMAVTALQPLAKDHIWVLKATQKKEELAKRVKNDVTWTLKTIIKSFDNKCDEKRIKAELVPAVLSAGEWTGWHAKAQNILKTDSTFDVCPSDISLYTVREHEASLEERLSNKFKAEKQFFPRIEILLAYLNDDNTDKSDESFNDMFSYFAAHLKAFTAVDEQIVASYLIVQHIIKLLPSFSSPAKFTFEELYKEIENPREMYAALKIQVLKEDFITNVRTLSDWDKQYIVLFPSIPNKDVEDKKKKKMLTELISSGKQDLVERLVQTSFEDYRNYREAVIYFFKDCKNDDWFKNLNLSYERQLITLVNIISQCYREIANHVNTTENKKIIKDATALLFAEKRDGGTYNNMLNYMLEHDRDVITRMYTMVNDVREIDPTYKAQLRNGILSKFPDFTFQEAEIKQEAPKGLMVTAKMLEIKRAEAENIEKVILPKIAEEVSEARAKGDLKENAEYSAAKEAQHIQNDKLARLKVELSQAVTFDPTTITTSFVSFGTVVTLHNNKENTDVSYTILGPWESAPDKGIISYLSPLGDRLLDAKVNETRRFTINDNSYDYTVLSITAAKV